jgi:hypothetical protein
MPEKEVLEVAEKAKIIVNGYAFSGPEDGLVRILNLNHPDCAMVVRQDGELIETNMDPIEQQIVLELCRKNLQFMED